MRRRREDEAGGQEIAELAALADGSLAPERRAALEARVAASSGARRPACRAAAGGRARAERRGPRSRRRRPCGRASRRNDVRAACRCRRRLVLIGAAATAALAVAIGLAVFRFGHLRRSASTPPSHATDLVPGARGEATLTKTSSGWRIELDATGLPRLDGGRFYEAWLRNAAGVLVPIGTFNEGRKVTLWAGVSPKRLHDADRHARAGRRRSGLVGREGARRNGRRRRLVSQAEPPSIRRTTCWRAR